MQALSALLKEENAVATLATAARMSASHDQRKMVTDAQRTYSACERPCTPCPCAQPRYVVLACVCICAEVLAGATSHPSVRHALGLMMGQSGPGNRIRAPALFERELLKCVTTPKDERPNLPVQDRGQVRDSHSMSPFACIPLAVIQALPLRSCR